MHTLLLDRDGVLTEERDYDYTPENIRLLPGVAAGLKRLEGWRLFVVSNQSGVARGTFTAADVDACHERLRELLAAEGVTLEDIVYCPHHPDDACECRKPKLGMWRDLAVRYGLAPADCVMVGNRDSDTAFGRAIGCMTVRVLESSHPLHVLPDCAVSDLEELADVLLGTNKEKVMTVGEAAAFAAKMRQEGRRIVTTNGAFDLFHGGHRFLLDEARKHGDAVIVGVNSDANVRARKGEGRPVERQEIRAEKVARHADAVFVFDDPDPRAWLPLIRPHVHANADTYGHDCVEAPVLRDIGADLLLVPVRPELGSTTALLHA